MSIQRSIRVAEPSDHPAFARLFDELQTGDDATALEDAGAIRHLEIEHMRGPVAR